MATQRITVSLGLKPVQHQRVSIASSRKTGRSIETPGCSCFADSAKPFPITSSPPAHLQEVKRCRFFTVKYGPPSKNNTISVRGRSRDVKHVLQGLRYSNSPHFTCKKEGNLGAFVVVITFLHFQEKNVLTHQRSPHSGLNEAVRSP